MTGNGFISWVLRSPFHGLLGNGMLLITVTGRKTGRKYTTPVGYYREGDESRPDMVAKSQGRRES